MIHELKIHTEYFNALFAGHKNFEVRKNDHDFKIGDELLLKDYNTFTNKFTGRFLHRRVIYILKGGQFGIQDGYCVLSLEKI